MMRAPDPFGYGDYNYTYHSPDEGIWYGDPNDYDGYDLASLAIREAAQTAQIIGSGYPPGSNVSIQYPSYPESQPQPSPMPQYMPQGQPQPGKTGVLNLSTNELLILGLITFAFIFGKRGR